MMTKHEKISLKGNPFSIEILQSIILNMAARPNAFQQKEDKINILFFIIFLSKILLNNQA